MTAVVDSNVPVVTEQSPAEPAAASDNAMERVDFLKLYQEQCAELACRCNSAVVNMLKAQPHRPLQHLRLANNYVGPRGFQAVLHLVQQCQTIEELDLRGNGLDNGAVQALCKVLEQHLGVARIALDSNPIALDAGHSLMRLMSTNRNIVECTVAGTDIPPGVCDRIAQAAAENHERVTGKKPSMVPSRPIALRAASASSSAGPTTGASARARLVAPNSPLRAGATPKKPNMPTNSESVTPTTTPADRKQATTLSLPGDGGMTPSSYGAATLSGSKPRPPPPAIASDFHSRLTPEHRRELRDRYKRRAEQYRAESSKSESGRSASAARSELTALEAAQERVQAKRDTDAASRVPRSLPKLLPKGAQKADAAEEQEAAEATPSSRSDRPRASKRREGGSPEEKPGAEPPTDDHAAADSKEDGEQPSATKATRFVIDGETTAPERAPQHKVQSVDERPSASLTAELDDVATAAEHPTSGDAPDGASAQLTELVVDDADQFKVLFNMGCRHYNEKNLDAAYKAWTDALDLATAQRNREWMALLTDNLQGLSYEVLTAETNKHIDDDSLDDAERTLALAERIATRARKATWMAEVARVRQRVLRGQFQRYHERAEERFEQLQQYRAVEVTDDDRYEEDGVLIRHTSLYVNEWAQMLLVKEAVEGWSEAYQRGKEVGGQQGRAMQEVVDTAVASLTTVLLERYYSFEKEGPSTLTSFHTWGLTEMERAKLLELWRDISSKARQLQNPRWELLQAGQIGNLLFASHEITPAIEQFRLMAERAESCNDRYLLAAAKYFTGVAHFQRSSFADADIQFLYAVELMNDVRRELPDPSKQQPVAPSPIPDPASAPGSATYGSALTPQAASAGAGRSASSLSDERHSEHDDASASSWPSPRLAANLHSRVYYMRSRCFASTYKFVDALEMHERSLVSAHCDVLYEKMTKNFNQPSRDHIRCVAATMQAPLVYFVTHYRHEWDPAIEAYAITEHLYIWVVPADGAAKFTLVDVEKDHRVKSVLHVVDRVRKALSVQPNNEDTTTDLTTPNGQQQQGQGSDQAAADGSIGGIRLEPPEVQWREPLRDLYGILLHRVVDTIAAFAQYTNQNGFVVIPHGYLWLVPFGALVDREGRHVVENFTVTHGLSATQLATSALSWKNSCTSSTERRLVISQPEAQPSSIEPYLAFLTDSHRAEAEANVVVEQLGAELITGTATDAVRIPTQLPKARLVHISSPVLSDCARNNMTGGIAATTSYDQLGIMHATEIAFNRTRAELVVHTNVNITRDAMMNVANEGSIGWMRALLGSGVTSCIFPLWCTPDVVPADFAAQLYSELERHNGHKARAVAAVMRSMLAASHTPSGNPRVWAPYIVLGFPPGLEKTRPSSSSRSPRSPAQQSSS